MKIVLRRRKIQSIFSVSMSPFGLHLRSGILMCTYESLLIIPCRRRLLDRELSMETTSSYSSCRKFLFRQKMQEIFRYFYTLEPVIVWVCIMHTDTHELFSLFWALFCVIMCVRKLCDMRNSSPYDSMITCDLKYSETKKSNFSVSLILLQFSQQKKRRSKSHVIFQSHFLSALVVWSEWKTNFCPLPVFNVVKRRNLFNAFLGCLTLSPLSPFNFDNVLVHFLDQKFSILNKLFFNSTETLESINFYLAVNSRVLYGTKKSLSLSIN